MPITYPISMPSNPGFAEVIWRPQSAVVVQPSEFTFHQKVYAWEGQMRVATVKLPPILTLAQAKQWQVWALKLNGTEGTFYLSDETIQHIAGEAPVDYALATVATGGGAVGDTLVTTGWPTSVTDLLKAGDMFSVADKLFTVLEDVDSNGSGVASIQVWPNIRTAIANGTAVKIGANARGIFRLVQFPEFGWDAEKIMQNFEFAAMEVI